MEGSAGYLMGQQFTMADVHLFPCLAFALRLQLKLEPWPRLEAYCQTLRDRPSILASRPPHWAGSQGRDYFQGF
ncbi:hypothetical protein ACOMHN_006624 [Nucella lapillus]